MNTSFFLDPLKPTSSSDRYIVRVLTGGKPALESALNAIPSHWRLIHITMPVDNTAVAVVFERDPSQAKPGDFDYVAPIEAAPLDRE